MDEVLERILEMSVKARGTDAPLSWFEELYAQAGDDWTQIPWAAMQPNGRMVSWYEEKPIQGKALVIGCGLGDDAAWLDEQGMDVVAFDLSHSCVEWAKRRFPDSCVDWIVADILAMPEEWKGAFDLVVEIHILQAVPTEIRDACAASIPGLLTANGTLLCIGRVRDNLQPEEPGPPWTLTESWMDSQFTTLKKGLFERFVRSDTPEVNRFCATWSKGNY